MKSNQAPTELAHASGVPRRLLNMELSRLVKYGVLTRFAQGLYGLRRGHVPDDLLAGLLKRYPGTVAKTVRRIMAEGKRSGL